MNKRSLSLLLATSAFCLLSGSLFAGGPGDFDHSAPMHKFSVFGEGMLALSTIQIMQTTGSCETCGTGGGSAATLIMKPKYTWGVMAGAAYRLTPSSILSVDYTQTAAKSDASTVMRTNGEKTESGIADITDYYYDVNLQATQLFKWSDHFTFYTMGGLNYSQASPKDRTQIKTTDSSGVVTFTQSFKGIGPRLGLGAIVSINPSLSINGGLSFDLPVGKLTTKSYTASGSGTFQENSSSSTKTTVVNQQMNAQMALHYHPMPNAHFSPDLALGYRIKDSELIQRYGPFVRLSVSF